MGIKDLLFGKKEGASGDEKTPKDKPALRGSVKVQVDPVEVQEPPVSVTPSSADLDAELVAIQALMQQEQNLGVDYFAFLKSLGKESDLKVYSSTLRTVNAVREQFSVGKQLTWSSLITSAQSCVSWLRNYRQKKTGELTKEHQEKMAAFTMRSQEIKSTIAENEEKMRALALEIDRDQKKLEGIAVEQGDFEMKNMEKSTAVATAVEQLVAEIDSRISIFEINP